MNKNYIIVTDNEKLELLRNHISEFEYFAFDTETTGLNVRKNKVIGLSVSGQIGTAFYLPLLTWDKLAQQLVPVWGRDKFEHILKALCKKDLITWNGSFDARIVKNDFGIDIVPAILADGMLMKHTVQEDGTFGLKETAIELAHEIGLGDIEVAANEEQITLKANVIANGGTWLKSNKEMFKADLEVMGPYACADADLTLRLAQYYNEKLAEEGLEEFFYDTEVMPLYKEVTIPMEDHGVKLDLPLIEQAKIDIAIDMAALEKDILADLNAIPEVLDWQKQKAEELYPPSNKGAFAQEVCALFDLPLPKTTAGKYSLTAKGISSLPESAAKHFLQGEATLNPGMNFNISWKLFIKNDEHLININSKPQMGHIAFECLGIKPLGTTPGGKPQFDDDMIQALADKHKLNWAEKLSNYNKLLKLSSTYIDRFLDAHEDGYYYFTYKQHGTVSGRYSGDAQQMPRPKEEEELAPVVLKYVNIIRSFFIAEEGRVFIDCDYESLEPHVFSHVSNDERLRDIFRKGHDFYSTIAIATEKLEGVSADKKAPNYLGKVNKQVRQKSKAYSLGIPYGLGDYALGMSLNVSKKEAATLIEGYLSGFPDLACWMEESEEFVKHHGFIRVQTGRVRHLPRVKEIYKKHGDRILDWRYKKDLTSKLSRTMSYDEAKAEVQTLYRDYKNGLNNGKNVQIQGLSASIINVAMIEINKQFKAQRIDGYVCATIHDQAIMNVPEKDVELATKIIEKAMTTTTKLSVDLKAPPAVSHNWKDGH